MTYLFDFYTNYKDFVDFLALLLSFLFPWFLWLFKRQFCLNVYSKIISVFVFENFPERSKYFSCHALSNLYKLRPERATHLDAASLIGMVKPAPYFGRYSKKGRSSITAQKGSGFDRKVKKFVDNLMIDFNLLVKSSLWIGDELEVKKCRGEKVLNKVILPCFNEKTPQVITIRGKVGCGKTTLITNIGVAAQVYNQTERPNSGDILTVAIDVRKVLVPYLEGMKDYRSFVEDPVMPDTMYKAVVKTIVEYIQEAGIPGVDPNKSIYDAIEACYSVNVRPLIVLDEFDYLYTDFAKRCIASKEGPSDELLRIYGSIFKKIFGMIKNIPSSGGMGFNNTIFIISARSSTLRLFEEALILDYQSDIHDIKLQEFSGREVKEIIIKQIEALAYSSSEIVVSNSRKTVELLRNEEISFNKNLEISVHGLRHVINTIVRLANEDPTCCLLKEVITHPGLFRLYQYIDGNPEYSQAHEGIANIFLVNSDMPKREREQSYPSVDFYDIWLLQSHLQTYWLKYLMCELINKKYIGTDRANPVCFNDVVNTFSCKTSQTKNQFESSIVKLALVNASRVDHGRLIKFGFNDGMTIIPSSRFINLSVNDNFWDFGYLMVVVEDRWLEFPNALYDLFKLKEGKSVYDFVTSYHSMSLSKKYEFIEYKAKLSLTFLEILFVALDFEQKRYSDVFRRLNESGISLEVYSDKRAHLCSSIRSFTRSYLNDVYEGKIDKFIKEFEKDINEIRSKSMRCFKGYQGGKVAFKSISDKMAVYYNKRES